MSELLPSLVPLDKGLNLQTAKVVAEPGSVLDALNYEQVDFQGQKRIDGFVRYDGSVLSALDEYYVITLNAAYVGAVGDLIGTEDGLTGLVAGISGPVVYAAIINYNTIPAVGDTLYKIVDGVNTDGIVVESVTTGTDSGVTVEQHYTNLLTFSAALRARVEELPGAIAGLHWFRDRLYAVAGVTAVSLTGTTPVIYPNDTLTVGSTTVNVLDAYVLDNTRLIFVDAMDPAPWQVVGASVSRNAVNVGTVATGFEGVENFASFFESRTEEQVLAEDGPDGPFEFGWRFKHLGWQVAFADGISLFGSLPSLNQNIDGIGTQGPTSTTGESGRPLTLLQNVHITTGQAQVNGWKSSNTPTSYSLDPDNLESDDSLYIYADAFIAWDGTSGAVTAPGLTSSTLEQYPADAHVELD